MHVSELVNARPAHGISALPRSLPKFVWADVRPGSRPRPARRWPVHGVSAVRLTRAWLRC